MNSALFEFLFSSLWEYMAAAVGLGTLIVTSLWVDLNSKFKNFFHRKLMVTYV